MISLLSIFSVSAYYLGKDEPNFDIRKYEQRQKEIKEEEEKQKRLDAARESVREAIDKHSSYPF